MTWMRRMWRTRRPLLALLVLVAALVVGYAVDASRSHDDPPPRVVPSTSTSSRP